MQEEAREPESDRNLEMLHCAFEDKRKGPPVERRQPQEDTATLLTRHVLVSVHDGYDSVY